MVKHQNLQSINRQSARLGLDRRVLDEVSKKQRIKLHLEALEKDNVQDDPHANVVWNKAIPKFADELVYLGSDGGTGKAQKRKASSEFSSTLGETGTKKGRKMRAEFAKTRFRKTFAQLLDEEEQRLKVEETNVLSYNEIKALPSLLPPRKFCSVCGLFSKYNCVRCSSKYCSIRCRDIHNETRCLRWTV